MIMKKNFFSLLLCTICGTLLISCENDNATSGRSPVFEKIVLTPNPCETGDTIQGVVSYTSAGQHIYKTTYYVRVVGSTTSGDSIFHKQTWDVSDPTKSEPTFKFAAPDVAQTYTVTLGASRINYSTGGPNGELYGSANTVTTNLIVRSEQ